MRASCQFLSASFLVATAIFAACRSAETLPVDRVQLVTNQSARLASGVTVQVDAIQDSRCPEGVQCFVAGWVSVKTTLSKEPDQKQVSLTTGSSQQNGLSFRPDSTGILLAGTTYKVILRDVTPYPKIGSSEPKQALIQVTKL